MAGSTRFRIGAGGALHGRGGPAVGTAITSRTNPARGTYMPNDHQYAGLLPGWTSQTLTPYTTTDTGGYIYLTTANAVYENILFWGSVRPNAPGIVFRNCHFAGGVTSTGTGVDGIDCQTYGNTTRGTYPFSVYDSLFDASAWLDPTLNTSRGAPVPFGSFQAWNTAFASPMGVHGAFGHVERCEITNFGDGWNFLGTIATGHPEMYDWTSEIIDCWVHKLTFWRSQDVTGLSNPGSYGPHPDCFQTNTGRNITITGNYFGGIRNDANNYYNETYPYYNNGDDANNSCIMLQQESGTGSVDDTIIIENVSITQNFFEGGDYSINHSSKWSATFPNTSITDNFFVYRADGHYVIRSLSYASMYSNNLIITLSTDRKSFTVGGEITYTRGA